jgi:hypothetical protein
MVKVSHHGAHGSHCEQLYEDFCRGPETIAILSVGGNDELHPHPDVVDSLRKNKIRTYATCWPCSDRPRRGRPSSLILLGRPAGDDFACADLTVDIDSHGKIAVAPAESRL